MQSQRCTHSCSSPSILIAADLCTPSPCTPATTPPHAVLLLPSCDRTATHWTRTVAVPVISLTTARTSSTQASMIPKSLPTSYRNTTTSRASRSHLPHLQLLQARRSARPHRLPHLQARHPAPLLQTRYSAPCHSTPTPRSR